MNTKASRQDKTGLNSVEPDSLRDAEHFRRIIAARHNLAAAEKELHDAVSAARKAGDSWTIIGAAMGTTRQAAFQRFGNSTSIEIQKSVARRRRPDWADED